MPSTNCDQGLDSNNIQEEEEECWGLSPDFELFANYQVKTIFYPFVQEGDTTSSNNECKVETKSLNNRKSFEIEFMEPDSPLDILNKDISLSQYDATGHCVWTGAFLLIECLKDLQRENLFLGKKRIIEFGCGTGIGGLALALWNTRGGEDASTFVCFTDTDPAVLQVCKRNCILNRLNSDQYSIKELTWGAAEQMKEGNEYGMLYDVGLATDVLYDVDLIDPLFASVTTLVATGGIFILSHIPRACYNEGNPPEAVQDLEKYIVDKAQKNGLVLEKIIRPPCPEELSREILNFCPKNAFYGAGLFVFFVNQKKKE